MTVRICVSRVGRFFGAAASVANTNAAALRDSERVWSQCQVRTAKAIGLTEFGRTNLLAQANSLKGVGGLNLVLVKKLRRIISRLGKILLSNRYVPGETSI